MPEHLDVAVVGAGPFGLSVAAHLAHERVRVFGEPMQTWRTRMPPDMRLRSDWEATSLSAPGDRGSISVWARAAGDPDVVFAIERQDYSHYDGGRVIVVGGGQGGLEAAALARRGGAEVEVVVRSALRWFADHQPYRPRGALRRRAFRLAYPVVGYGPPPLNRFATHPDAFALLPAGARRRVAGRILRAGGSPWVRDEI